MTRETTAMTTGRRRHALVVSGLLLLTVGCMPADDSPEVLGGSDEAARVGDVVITMEEVEAEAAAQLAQLESQRTQFEVQQKKGRSEILEGAVGKMVENQLLEIEAESRGISAEELLTTEVNDQLQPVTDAEIETFYEQNKRAGMAGVDQVREQIRQHLEQQRRVQARAKLMGSLRAKYDVEVFLADPRTEVAAVGPALGPEGAPVTIVEFSDFQCPYCARFVPTLKQVAATYGDQVRIVYRHFPLDSIHSNARKAAEASLCADEQGKFWEMHDAIFENQQALAVEQLKTTAAGLGLEAGLFDECLDSGRYEEQVEGDLQDGVKAGVQGTPAIFVNGRFLSGAVPFQTVAKMIDEELADSPATSSR